MPDPGRPTPRQEAPPPGALVPPPQRAKPARKSARYGVGEGSPRPQPPHPQPVSSGPRPHARKDEWSGVKQCPTVYAARQGKRRPPWAPSCRPHNAQSQHSRARAVGLVTGPHARTPRTHSQWVVGPGRMPERTSGRGWESARPRTPHTQARGAPPRAPSCRPHSAQSQLARARAVGLVTGPHARTPRTHSQWVVGPGRTPERTSGRGWESARPRTPHTKAGGAPHGHPHAAPTTRKASSQERALWGGDGSPRPHPPHPQPMGTGPRPHARKDERSGVGERPTPDAPHPGKRHPPWAPSCRPHSAPSQHARLARKSARRGSPRPHPPHGERAARSQLGGNGTGPPPYQASQTEHGTEAGHAEGHGPSGTALQAPSTGTARGARATPTRAGGRGRGRGRRESASAHRHKGHAGKTRRATGPSPRNAQTAWNGVPASEDKGHPDGTV